MTSDNTHAHDHDEKAGWRELLLPAYATTTATLCLGVALFAFNSFLVSTSLPTAVAEIGGAELISWSLSLFLAAAILAGSVSAFVSRMIGARLAMIGAAVVFILGTLLAATAGSMPQVLMGRLLQGVGDGTIGALCYSLITVIYPSRLVPKVFGTEAAVWAIAAFGGPLLAGFLTETISWRAAFYVNVPMTLLFIAGAWKVAPKKTEAQSAAATSSRLPLLRLTLLAVALAALLSAGVMPATLAAILIAVCVASLIATYALDQRSGNAMLPRGAFAFGPVIGPGFWTLSVMCLAQGATGVYLVYSMQYLWHLGPTLAGAVPALHAMAWSLAALVVAHLSTRRLRRATLVIGPLLQASGILLIVIGLAYDQMILVIAAQLLTGSAFGASWGNLSQTLMEATPAAERDKTSTMIPTLQSFGYAFGGGLAGLIGNFAGFARDAGTAELRTAMVAAFAASAVAAVIGVFAGWRTARPAHAERADAALPQAIEQV